MLAIPRKRNKITSTASPATIQMTTPLESPSNITPPPTKAIPSSQLSVLSDQELGVVFARFCHHRLKWLGQTEIHNPIIAVPAKSKHNIGNQQRGPECRRLQSVDDQRGQGEQHQDSQQDSEPQQRGTLARGVAIRIVRSRRKCTAMRSGRRLQTLQYVQAAAGNASHIIAISGLCQLRAMISPSNYYSESFVAAASSSSPDNSLHRRT